MTDPSPTLAELAEVLERTAFLKPYGFRVESFATGTCTLRVPFNAALERPGGIVSGMTLMGAADVAMWLAIMTLRGTREHWVTSDMKRARRTCCAPPACSNPANDPSTEPPSAGA